MKKKSAKRRSISPEEGSLPKLCRLCIERQGLGKRSRFTMVSFEECSLCKGILGRLDSIARRVFDRLSLYEFETFLVGTSVPQSIIDNEDELRSMFKIKGKESFKSQVNHSIGREVSKLTGKRIEFSHPDVTVLASLSDEAVTVSSRSIWASGRYLKKARGLPQRSSTCATCNGLGCANCNYKGKSERSVQSILSAYLGTLFGSEDYNFIWIGSEDENSLVLGSGRPFYVEVLNPKRRNVATPKLEKRKRSKTPISLQEAIGLQGIEVKSFNIMEGKPSSIPQFKIHAQLNLKRKEATETTEIRLSDIERDFAGKGVQVRLSRRFRLVSKVIEKVSAVQDEGGRLTIDVFCDGGIPLKKLVGGLDDSVNPNFSGYILGYEIDEEEPFDILDVILLPPRDAETARRPPRRIGRRRSFSKLEYPSTSHSMSEEELVLEN